MELNLLDTYNLKDPVCMYKLGWSTVRLYNSVSQSCHRVVSNDIITPETFDSFHNTPSKIKARESMFNGQWPEETEHVGCNYCKKIEDAGGLSDRHIINRSYNSQYVTEETKSNPRSSITTPTMLEVYFTNLCNMSCIYCNSLFSSKWEAEDLKHNFDKNKFRLEKLREGRKTYSAMKVAFWKWFEKNVSKLKSYNILGGEPFYQQELVENIEFFNNNECPDLEINIFSNLKVEPEKFKDILNSFSNLIKLKKIKSLTLFCSFDCWGPQIEYIRYGLNLNKWEENFNILINDYPEIKIVLHSTLTSLTFDTFPQLCEKVKKWQTIRQLRHSISIAGGNHWHPGIFSKDFFTEKINEAISFSNDKDFIVKLDGFNKSFNAHNENKHEIRILKQELDRLDKIRNTNWKLLWPWLDKYEV